MERTEPQDKEANRTPNYHNIKRPSAKHIIAKLSKINDKEFSRQSEKRRWKPIKETQLDYHQIFQQELQARREWNQIFKILKEKSPAKKNISSKLSFRSEGEIKTFPHKQKLREFTCITSNAKRFRFT